MTTSYSVPKNVALVIARILISYLFISAGLGKILHFDSTVSYIASHGMPVPAIWAIIALLIEIGGGLMILLGFKARLGAIALAIFVIVITPIFHTYWHASPDEVGNQMNNFYKNGAILGGLIYVIAFGAGRFALTRCQSRPPM